MAERDRIHIGRYFNSNKIEKNLDAKRELSLQALAAGAAGAALRRFFFPLS